MSISRPTASRWRPTGTSASRRHRLHLPAVEATHLQLLSGDDAVLNGTRGAGIRPILNAPNRDEAAAFRAEYGIGLSEAYPPTSHGTWFPFRRIFCFGHLPAASSRSVSV